MKVIFDDTNTSDDFCLVDGKIPLGNRGIPLQTRKHTFFIRRLGNTPFCMEPCGSFFDILSVLSEH